MKNLNTDESVEAAAGSQQNQPWSSWTRTDFDTRSFEQGDLSPSIPVVIWIVDRQGQFTLSEGNGLSDLGLEPGEVVGKSLYNLYADVPQIIECVERALDGETVESTIQLEDSRWNAYYYPTHNAKGRITGVTCVAFNISNEQEKLRRQKLLMDLAAAMRSITTRKVIPANVLEKLLNLFQAKGALILSLTPPNHDLKIKACSGLEGFEKGKTIHLNDYPWLLDSSEQIISTAQPVRKEQISELLPFAHSAQAIAGAPISGGEKIIGVIWILRDQPLTNIEMDLLTDVGEVIGNAFQHAEEYEQTQRRLHRLSALHAIDQAITGTFDLNVTLNVILDQVVTQLEVDAADIFLYKAKTHTLEFGEGRGFNHTDSSHQHVRERVGLLWQVARERALVNIPNLPQRTQTFVRRSLIEEEGFVTYFGIPLIAKGETKGVLEVFHRSEFQIDKEWISFFKTLANQAAIAIDNAALFEDLRKSNMKLDLAYHSTLEGWVHALDLRDEESQGHTKRVTQRTLRLAKAMGINSEDLVHIRRGALLHDIGKLAIPDHILNKNGALTEEEWDQIKKHPLYAQEMLSEIEYLHPALDIPYCHHEKWDGSGYPRGLKGERIPLAARIFAVIDVWDSLTNDRPYRDAWPEQKAIQYILEHTGTHFDPSVVETWMELFDIETPEKKELEDLFR